MTLDQLIERRGKPLEKNDYEFIMGDDGLGHIVFCMGSSHTTDRKRVRTYVFDFFCPCGHFLGKEKTIGGREISPNLTCLACSSR